MYYETNEFLTSAAGLEIVFRYRCFSRLSLSGPGVMLAKTMAPKKPVSLKKSRFLKTSDVFSCVFSRSVSISVIFSIIFNYILYVKRQRQTYIIMCIQRKKVLFFNNLKLHLRENK